MDALELDLSVVAPSVHGVQALLLRGDVPEAGKRQLIQRTYLQAASGNRTELLEYLLGWPAARTLLDINSPDEDGTPALILAAFSGHGDVVRLLLEAGASIDAQDARGWTALMWSLQTNSEVERASAFIRQGQCQLIHLWQTFLCRASSSTAAPLLPSDHIMVSPPWISFAKVLLATSSDLSWKSFTNRRT